MAGALGGKTVGSNVIMSLLRASNNVWRRVPGPLSAVLITTIVLGGVSVGEGVGVGFGQSQ